MNIPVYSAAWFEKFYYFDLQILARIIACQKLQRSKNLKSKHLDDNIEEISVNNINSFIDHKTYK